ncbi:MAG: sulfurtransferase-like selenium metabolism protein YedF [Proteobacteria bacterium]|nr:sulfurtransferase-like selenium metabolism protein YedF [Pseudomonadota bacterium]MBU1739077.1 sulfurtransferase-like selenium metabolism protein YedF [Pseudomonadota bacterium]
MTEQLKTNACLVIYINSESIGSGDSGLGKTLMGAYMETLSHSINEISHIILINSGVKLACKGSPVADDLKAFAEVGVRILSCGTCLKFYGIKDRLEAGEVSNMVTIVDTLKKAGKVLSP